MKFFITFMTTFMTSHYLMASSANIDKNKKDLINEVQSSLILNYFPESDSFKDSAEKIKTQMTTKMEKNYSLKELKELKTIAENKTFLAVNNKFQNQDIKVEDILMKSSSDELKKIDSKKQPIITSIKNSLNLEKYSMHATHIFEKKLDEQLPEGLPEMALKPLKEGLKTKAQDGLIGTVYEQLGKIETKDLTIYQQQVKKKSFSKYYNDLMDVTYNVLK